MIDLGVEGIKLDARSIPQLHRHHPTIDHGVPSPPPPPRPPRRRRRRRSPSPSRLRPRRSPSGTLRPTSPAGTLRSPPAFPLLRLRPQRRQLRSPSSGVRRPCPCIWGLRQRRPRLPRGLRPPEAHALRRRRIRLHQPRPRDPPSPRWRRSPAAAGGEAADPQDLLQGRGGELQPRREGWQGLPRPMRSRRRHAALGEGHEVQHESEGRGRVPCHGARQQGHRRGPQALHRPIPPCPFGALQPRVHGRVCAVDGEQGRWERVPLHQDGEQHLPQLRCAPWRQGPRRCARRNHPGALGVVRG